MANKNAYLICMLNGVQSSSMQLALHMPLVVAGKILLLLSVLKPIPFKCDHFYHHYLYSFHWYHCCWPLLSTSDMHCIQFVYTPRCLSLGTLSEPPEGDMKEQMKEEMLSDI